jgi:hypothetical protein
MMMDGRSAKKGCGGIVVGQNGYYFGYIFFLYPFFVLIDYPDTGY